MYRRLGACDAGEIADREVFWQEKLDALAKAAGVEFAGEREMREAQSGYEMWAMAASNELYEVRLDMAFPPASALADDGAEKSGTEAEGEPPAPRRPPVEWRELCVEKTLPGFEIPPRPQPPKF